MYKYIGNSWVPGVPARDLTNKEFEKHKELLEKFNSLSLYQKIEKKEKDSNQENK